MEGPLTSDSIVAKQQTLGIYSALASHWPQVQPDLKAFWVPRVLQDEHQLQMDNDISISLFTPAPTSTGCAAAAAWSCSKTGSLA